MIHSLTNKENKKNPLQTWQKEMNRLFDRFMSDMDFSGSDLGAIEPRVEIKEKNQNYIVKAEIPGMDEKNIQVTLRDNCLILEGERKEEQKKEEEGHYFSEFSYGSFYRAIPFEEEVDPESVNASYRNGILTVKLVKTGQGKHGEKIIPVKLS